MWFKYWKPAALALALGGIFLWHKAQMRQQFQAGKAAATAAISRDLAQAAAEQTAQTLAQERRAAAEFAAVQQQLEKEKQNAKTATDNLRRELNRVQHYAADQRARVQLPPTADRPGAPDETAATGWALFGKCTAEYAGMAEIADAQRNDLAEWQAYGSAVVQ